MTEKEEMEFLNLYCKEDPRMCPVAVTEGGELYQMFDVDKEREEAKFLNLYCPPRSHKGCPILVTTDDGIVQMFEIDEVGVT